MIKKIKEYKNEIDEILKRDDPNTDWDILSHELLAKIGFFQHERLVHLIVTMTVAILLVISTLFSMFLVEQPTPLALMAMIAMFLILVAPYIVHYYKLENSVQDIYKYYDMVREKAKNVI